MSTKSELKENILAAHLEGVVKWGLDHRPLVITTAAVIVVGILISSVFMIRQKEQAEQDWTRLSQAQVLSGQKQYAPAKEILTTISNNTPDKNIRLHALFQLGELAITEKNYDAAINHLTILIAQAGNSPLKPLALSNLGFAYEEKKDFTNAAQTYRAFMDEFAEHFMAARTQLALGRVYAASGNNEAAKTALTQLIDLYPTSPWAENARQIVDKL